MGNNNQKSIKQYENFGGLIGIRKRNQEKEAQEAQERCRLQCGDDLAKQMLKIQELESQLEMQKQQCEYEKELRETELQHHIEPGQVKLISGEQIPTKNEECVIL